jgi:hypothetical protein
MALCRPWTPLAGLTRAGKRWFVEPLSQDIYFSHLAVGVAELPKGPAIRLGVLTTLERTSTGDGDPSPSGSHGEGRVASDLEMTPGRRVLSTAPVPMPRWIASTGWGPRLTSLVGRNWTVEAGRERPSATLAERLALFFA